VIAGIAGAGFVALLGAGLWLYTGMGRPPAPPAPAPYTRPAPAPQPVRPAPAPVPAPVPVPQPPPRAELPPEPEPEPTPAPEPAPAVAEIPAPAPAPAPVPAPGPAAQLAPTPAPAPAPIQVPSPGPAPAPTTVVIVRPNPPSQVPAAADPNAKVLPSSNAFELSAPVHRFVDDWLRAQETHDASLFSSLGFRELPADLAGAWNTREGFRLVAASVDEERSTSDTVYLRVVVSYVFKDATGRFRTEDEERYILQNGGGTLRYEGRWSR